MPRVDDGATCRGAGIQVPGVYQALLAFERRQHERFGDLRGACASPGSEPGVYRRSRRVLEALEAGWPVTVARWQLGGHSKPAMPDAWRADRSHQWFVVTPDDLVAPTQHPPITTNGTAFQTPR